MEQGSIATATDVSRRFGGTELAELAAVSLTRDEFHGEWNYLINPTT